MFKYTKKSILIFLMSFVFSISYQNAFYASSLTTIETEDTESSEPIEGSEDTQGSNETGLTDEEADEIEKRREEQEKSIVQEIKDLIGSEIQEIITKTLEEIKNPIKRDNLYYLLYHTIISGNFIEDVENMVDISTEQTDKTMVHKVNNRHGYRKSVCYHKGEPQNLLNHNCDIPAFGTSLVHTLTNSTYKQGIEGAERTAAKLSGPLGDSVYKGNIPAELGSGDSFTMFEIYGYDLPLTSYYGEWDNIWVSTKERLMSNIGSMNMLRLTTTSLAKGVISDTKRKIGKLLNTFSFGVINIFSDEQDFLTTTAVSIADTADYTIAADGRWSRPDFVDTLYNVYYATDKEILAKYQNDYIEYLINYIEEKGAETKELKEVFYLAPDSPHFPNFEYDPKACKEYTTDEKGNSYCSVVKTYEEQFEEWKTFPTQQEFNERGLAQGIDCFKEDVKDFTGLKTCWTKYWEEYSKAKGSFEGLLVKELVRLGTKAFYEENPHANPSEQISHFFCGTEEGNAKGEKETWERVYIKKNTRNQEFVNEKCAKVRPSVKGTITGNGEIDKSDDDRYIHFVKSNDSRRFGNISVFSKSLRGLSISVTKITNTLINLSNSNIITTLKIDKILESILKTFKTSIFFPLAILFMGASAITIFFTSRGTGLKDLAVLLICFMIGAMCFTNIPLIVKLVDEYPSKLDKIVVGAMQEITGIKESDVCSISVNNDDDYIRMIQCRVWEIGVFIPYLYAQWGTTNTNDLRPENLKYSESTKALVGTPEVYYGSTSKSNWALWQLSKIKTGSIRNESIKGLDGTKTREIYKLVDWQVGPKHSEGRDTRFFNDWSGASGKRNEAYIYGAIGAIATLIVIGTFSILKVETSLLMAFQLSLLPIYLVLALVPKGRLKFKTYIADLIHLVIRRLYYVILLSVSLSIFNALTKTNQMSYAITSIALSVLALGLIWYHKEVLNIINIPLSNEYLSTGSIKKNLNVSKILPKSLNLKYQQIKTSVTRGFAGAVGGGFVGLSKDISNMRQGVKRKDGRFEFIEGIKKGYAAEGGRSVKTLTRRERKEGFGLLTRFSRTNKAVAQMVKSELKDGRSHTRQNISALSYGVEVEIDRLINKQKALIPELKSSRTTPSRKRDISKELDDIQNAIKKLQYVDGKINTIAIGSDKQLKENNRVASVLFKYGNMDNFGKKGTEFTNTLQNFTNEVYKTGKKQDLKRQEESIRLSRNKAYQTLQEAKAFRESVKDGIDKSKEDIVLNVDKAKKLAGKKIKEAKIFQDKNAYYEHLIKYAEEKGYSKSVFDELNNIETSIEKRNQSLEHLRKVGMISDELDKSLTEGGSASKKLMNAHKNSLEHTLNRNRKGIFHEDYEGDYVFRNETKARGQLLEEQLKKDGLLSDFLTQNGYASSGLEKNVFLPTANLNSAIADYKRELARFKNENQIHIYAERLNMTEEDIEDFEDTKDDYMTTKAYITEDYIKNDVKAKTLKYIKGFEKRKTMKKEEGEW